MKSKLILLFLILSINHCMAQRSKTISVKSLEPKLIAFLITKKEIAPNQIARYTRGENHITITGVINGFLKDDLIDGIYLFSTASSHSKIFYLIIDDSEYKILDLSDERKLKKSIDRTIDFCGKKKYCSDLTKEYISLMVSVYYNINSNPLNRRDKNCSSDLKAKEALVP